MVMPGKAVGTLSGGVIATARTPNQGVPGLARSSGDKGGVESIRLNPTDPLDPPSDASTAKWQPVASEVKNRPSNRRGHTESSEVMNRPAFEEVATRGQEPTVSPKRAADQT